MFSGTDELGEPIRLLSRKHILNANTSLMILVDLHDCFTRMLKKGAQKISAMAESPLDEHQ